LVGVVEGLVVRGAGTRSEGRCGSWLIIRGPGAAAALAVGERAAGVRETTPGVVCTGGRNHSAPQRQRSWRTGAACGVWRKGGCWLLLSAVSAGGGALVSDVAAEERQRNIYFLNPAPLSRFLPCDAWASPSRPAARPGGCCAIKPGCAIKALLWGGRRYSQGRAIPQRLFYYSLITAARPPPRAPPLSYPCRLLPHARRPSRGLLAAGSRFSLTSHFSLTHVASLSCSYLCASHVASPRTCCMSRASAAGPPDKTSDLLCGEYGECVGCIVHCCSAIYCCAQRQRQPPIRQRTTSTMQWCVSQFQ
jgi:hypothetical protein